jgi:monooxygenase
MGFVPLPRHPDSDMHTLGFSFHPWKDKDAIAAGPKIKAYIEDTIDKFGIRPNLRLSHKLVSAHWDSSRARWDCVAERGDGSCIEFESRYLYMGSGYYNYESGHDPHFEGQESFSGQIVHPQFWPEQLDYKGKNVVIIGSGATAVTLLPAMAADCGHITMLQRSPTYIVARPGRDRIANIFKTLLPATLAYRAARWKNMFVGRQMRKRFMKNPGAPAVGTAHLPLA